MQKTGLKTVASRTRGETWRNKINWLNSEITGDRYQTRLCRNTPQIGTFHGVCMVSSGLHTVLFFSSSYFHHFFFIIFTYLSFSPKKATPRTRLSRGRLRTSVNPTPRATPSIPVEWRKKSQIFGPQFLRRKYGKSPQFLRRNRIGILPVEQRIGTDRTDRFGNCSRNRGCTDTFWLFY